MASGGAAGDPLAARVEALESAVRELTAEVARLRGSPEPAGSRPTPAIAAQATPLRDAPAVHPQPVRPAPKLDFESLVGRYGTLVLATVSGLAAIGTFIGWAIARGWLGPTQRVALGVLVAAGLAVGGLRLRRRERSFGASLLGLSLATLHVCAWGAGPSLHLVPEWVAFAVAAAASIALAVFAHAEADEPLWSVGFSGAAIAPFVTASGKSNLVLLAAYGVAVLSAAGYALGSRRWIVAGRLFLGAATLYGLALATGYERDHGPLLAMSVPLSVAVLGVVPWITGSPRRERLRALGALATLAALRTAFGTDFRFEPGTIALSIALAGIGWLVLVDRTHAVEAAPAEGRSRHVVEGDWLDAAVLPLGFVLAAVIALDGTANETGAALAAAAVVLLATLARLPGGGLRDGAAFAVSICAVVAAMVLLRTRPLELTVALAVLSTAAFAGNVAWRSATWAVMGVIGHAWAALATLVHLGDRPSYQYMPFWTSASAVAAAVLAGLLASWRLARDARMARMLRAGALVWAFAWAHQEIAFAFSRTVATLLLVSYYATTSVAAVGVGRARGVRLLRHAGLALAVFAAAMALYGARRLDAVGARITADLVAAVFLLAIAYWYRKPGASITEPSSPA